jgi:aryl-alcohol dehydrogenase-like predicted oxidoreductase
MNELPGRTLLSGAVAATALAACHSRSDERDQTTSLALADRTDAGSGASSSPIPRRPLGKTGVQVAILGVGGAHLGRTPSEDEATRIVHEALDAGLNFFDNAWEYNEEKSEERLGQALVGKRDQAFVMTKVCTHGRGADVAMQQLEDSLRRLKTDHLDLWQVHECVYENDPELHFAAGGVVEALDKAKQQGKVRFVGFTGHKDPRIHLKMLSRGYAFDTVQMPLNLFDASFRSFEQQVLPELARKQIAALGMKSLAGSGHFVVRGAATAEEALRYAMSLPVAVTISGMDSLDILHQNLAIARGFIPYTDEQKAALRARVAPLAADGHFELYKASTHFDAAVGREQHGYPTLEELPL